MNPTDAEIGTYIAGYPVSWLAALDRASWALTAEAPDLIGARLAGLDADYRIADGVAVHRRAVVEVGAIVKPPAIIGPECPVVAGAYLRGGCWLEAGCTVGPGSNSSPLSCSPAPRSRISTSSATACSARA